MMASKEVVLCLFLCIGWNALRSQAFPTVENLFKDSNESHQFMYTYSESLKQAFPNLGISPEEWLYSQSFQNKCLEDLGCFYNGPPFYHFFLRPTSFSPFDLKDMYTKFYLYTSRNERTLLEPNEESLAKSPYNKSLGLQLFIHGYQMRFTPEILSSTEKSLDTIMKADRQNILLVDWTASNQEPYAQAVANGRLVGAQVAQLVNFLQAAAGLDPRKVYIIGHSLGAHVSGWAGKMIPNLGRITGLDPAGPYFQYGDPEIRLDHTDADFVDIIHTDASDYYVNGLGIVQPIGDMDFYPNGGSHQPDCKTTFVNITYADAIAMNKRASSNILSDLCNHVRSLEYFVESAKNGGCKFIGTRCSNYEDFQQGLCRKQKTAEMGFFAKKDSRIPYGSSFYLETSGQQPYCKQ